MKARPIMARRKRAKTTKKAASMGFESTSHPYGKLDPVPPSPSVARRFRPPEGADLLQRLRGQPSERPAVDPGLAGGLRDWLEDGLAEAAAAVDDGALPVRVSKDGLTGVLTCEAHLVARRSAARVISEEMA